MSTQHPKDGKAMQNPIPDEILAVALKNARQRFVIPSTDNHFGGIKYDYVVVDLGCNSIVLPFPRNPAELARYNDTSFSWQIVGSQGTGRAETGRTAVVHQASCPMLVIRRADGLSIGTIVLAGRTVIDNLPFLSFHLGSQSARTLIALDRLDEMQRQKLIRSLAQLEGDDGKHFLCERRQVLLGQTALSKCYSLQAGKMLLILKKGYLPVREDLITSWNVVKNTMDKPKGIDEWMDTDKDSDSVLTCFRFSDQDDYNESFFVDELCT